MKPFTLNSWHVFPVQGEICQTSTSEAISLEPQLMAILCYLVNHQDKVISRQELASNVWPNVVVEDNTISKAIGRLRKALDDDSRSPKYIQTVPKRGYRIIATIGDLSPVELAETDSEQIIKSSDSKLVLYFNMVFVLLVFAFLFNFYHDENSNSVTSISYQVEPLTSRTGRDSSGSISYNGEYLAFVGEDEAGYAIFVKNIMANTVKKLTPVNRERVMPQWSPVTNTLVYSDKDNNAQCNIYLISHVPFNSSTPEKIAQCSNEQIIRAQWHPLGEQLFWVDNGMVHTMNLRTNALSKLTEKLSIEDVGFVSVSPDGQSLGVLHHQNRTSFVTIFQLDSFSVQETIAIGHEINHYVWSNTSQEIIYVGEHPADDIIGQTLQGEQRLVLSTGFGYLEQVSQSLLNGSIIATSSYVDIDIVERDGDQLTKLVDSSYPDYNARLSPNEKLLAFASKRSGKAQIWLKDEDDNVLQLTDFPYSTYIYDLVWSADSRKLLIKSNDDIYLITIASSYVTKLATSFSLLSGIGWLNEEQIYFKGKQGGESGHYVYELKNKQSRLLSKHYSFAQYDGHNWYVSKADDANIYKLAEDFSQETKVFTPPLLLADAKWRVEQGAIYFIVKGDADTLYSYTVEDGMKQLMSEARLNFYSLQVIADNKFLSTITTSNESNIIMLKGQ